MRRNTSQDLRWLRRYKLIAVTGMTAVVAVALECLMVFVAGRSASWITLLTCPIGVGTGYLIEHLMLRLSHADQSQEIDFTYESKIKIPRGLTILSCLITAVLMALFAYFIGSMLNLIRINMIGSNMEKKVLIAFRILLGAVFIIAGCLGCYLRPCAFNQIVGLRSLVECVAVFSFFGALQAIYGSYGISWFFLLCMIVYMTCMAIIMNQVHVIQPSYFSPTCHATDELRRAGIKAVFGMFGKCLTYVWLLVAGMSLLVFPLRVITFAGQREGFLWIFVFPFSMNPIVNMIIYILALITMIGFLVYIVIRAQNPEISHYLTRIKELLRRLWLCIYLLVSSAPSELRRLRKGKKKAEKEEDEPKAQTVYQDMVIRHPRRKTEETVISYGMFSRRVMAQPDAKAQYAYAYRTLVGCLRRKYIGIDEHTSPQEIADIVKARTNIRNIDNITSLFYASAYAPEAQAPGMNDIIALCDIVRAELEKERRTK